MIVSVYNSKLWLTVNFPVLMIALINYGRHCYWFPSRTGHWIMILPNCTIFAYNTFLGHSVYQYKYPIKKEKEKTGEGLDKFWRICFLSSLQDHLPARIKSPVEFRIGDRWVLTAKAPDSVHEGEVATVDDSIVITVWIHVFHFTLRRRSTVSEHLR